MNRREQLSKVETAAEKAYQLNEALYLRGRSDHLSTLEAQRSKLAISNKRIQAETAVRVSLVSIYRAFGGGWSGEPSVSRVDDIDGGKKSGLPVATDQ